MNVSTSTSSSVESVDLLRVPALTDMQAQGDLIILPWPESLATHRRQNDINRVEPITKTIVVLTGNGNHDHALSPAPGVAWYRYRDGGQTLGMLVVKDGAVAVLGHIEHGDVHIGPGVYVIRRQREQADIIRYVED